MVCTLVYIYKKKKKKKKKKFQKKSLRVPIYNTGAKLIVNFFCE
jgi:hypothetical protein